MVSDEPKLSWKEKIVRGWMGTRLAHEALQVQKDARRQTIVERLIRKTQDGTLGQKDAHAEVEPMGVHVGDITNHHYPPAARQQTGTLAKLAVVAALVAGGAGLGAGGPWLLDALQPPPADVTQPSDQDTLFDLRLVPDESP